MVMLYSVICYSHDSYASYVKLCYIYIYSNATATGSYPKPIWVCLQVNARCHLRSKTVAAMGVWREVDSSSDDEYEERIHHRYSH